MAFQTEKGVTQPMSSVIIGYHDFTRLIARRVARLLWLANYLSARRPTPIVLTRPLVGELLSQSIQVEELLDAYGARNSRQWSRFRSLTATIKLFADVGYELLHIRHSMPSYRLLPIERDFAKATARSLDFTHDVLTKASS